MMSPSSLFTEELTEFNQDGTMEQIRTTSFSSMSYDDHQSSTSEPQTPSNSNFKRSDRRKSTPTRSIASSIKMDQSASIEKVFKFDVYATYLRNPKRLLAAAGKRMKKLSLKSHRLSKSFTFPSAVNISSQKSQFQECSTAIPIISSTMENTRIKNVSFNDEMKGAGLIMNLGLIVPEIIYDRDLDSPFGKGAQFGGNSKAATSQALTKAKSSRAVKGHKPISGLVAELINEGAMIDMDDYMNTSGSPLVAYKGSPSVVTSDEEGYDDLTYEEVKTCEALRMTPMVYLHLKRTMITAVLTVGPFKKRDAQDWFRIDVNKTNKIYDWFQGLGWIPNWDFDERRSKKIPVAVRPITPP